MEILIAVVVVVAVVWGVALVLRGSLMAGCLAFLVVNACLGFYFFSTRVGPVELTLDRVVLVMLIVGYAIHRLTGRTQPKPLVTSDLALFAFLGWLTLRTFTAPWWLTRTGAVAPAWHLVVGYLSPLIIYWIVRQSPLNRRAVRGVPLFFVIFGVYLALTAMAEVTHQWWAALPPHIANPKIGLHFGRARGPMVQSIVLGFCLSICAVSAWLYRGRFGWQARWLVTGLVPLMLVGVFFTYTRCVWMGAALGLMIVLGLSLPPRIRTVLVGGVLTVLLLLTLTEWDQLLNLDAGRSAAETRDSTYMRASFAYVSWQMFTDHPLLGVGLGQYPREKDPYLVDRSTPLRLEGIRDQLNHNLFLSILVETGLPGLLLFLAMLGTMARDGWRLWRDRSLPDWVRGHGLLVLGAIGAYLPNALFQPLGHMNTVHMMLFFLAGISAGLVASFVPASLVARPTAAQRADVMSPAGC